MYNNYYYTVCEYDLSSLHLKELTSVVCFIMIVLLIVAPSWRRPCTEELFMAAAMSDSSDDTDGT